MQAHIALNAQVVAFGNAIAHGAAAHFTDQIDGRMRQLFRPQIFCRQVNYVADPVDDFQTAIKLRLLMFAQRWPLNLALPFRATEALPECPALLQVPAFAGQRHVADALAVDFVRRTLNSIQRIRAGEMQRHAAVVAAQNRFFAPARIGGLAAKRNVHGLCGHRKAP